LCPRVLQAAPSIWQGCAGTGTSSRHCCRQASSQPSHCELHCTHTPCGIRRRVPVELPPAGVCELPLYQGTAAGRHQASCHTVSCIAHTSCTIRCRVPVDLPFGGYELPLYQGTAAGRHQASRHTVSCHLIGGATLTRGSHIHLKQQLSW
jgi:hypothetical protein